MLQLSDFSRDGIPLTSRKGHCLIVIQLFFALVGQLIEAFVVFVQRVRKVDDFSRLVEITLQTSGHGIQRTGDRVSRRRQQFPEHQRNQLPLTFG
ncbi:hypothetical protein D3C78_1298010 [compost metagenome]